MKWKLHRFYVRSKTD